MGILQGNSTPVAQLLASGDVSLDPDGNWFRVLAACVATGSWTVQAMYSPDGGTTYVPCYPATTVTLAGATLTADIPISGGYPGLILRCTMTAPASTLDVYCHKGNDREGGV